MNSRAQAGLEYLMTYGWALILVATIITVLVFVVGKPTGGITFSSSDPTKISLKGGTYNAATGFVEVILQNISGGRIRVTGFTLDGTVFYDTGTVKTCGAGSKLNNKVCNTFAPASTLDVIAGGELRFTEINYIGSGTGKIEINYTDYANMIRKVTVSGTKQGAGAYCGDDYCTGSEDEYTCPSDCGGYY